MSMQGCRGGVVPGGQGRQGRVRVRVRVWYQVTLLIH